MYLAHFGLTEQPFGLTPDTSYIYSGESHQAALNTLLIGLSSGEGFIKITGEVGTGKSLLCRRFLSTLTEKQVVAYLPNPMLEPRILLVAIAEELGLKLEGLDYQFHLVNDISAHLLKVAGEGKTVVVCVDEAQCMPLESLETLRLLSNLETEKRKLVQVVMFGQPELDVKLSNPAVRQLSQRIVFHYRIATLKPAEIGYYLAHRLRVAGYQGVDLFTPVAVKFMYLYSGGTPRLLNVLAHKAMLLAFGEGKRTVTRAHVVAAGRDTESARRVPWYLGG